MPESRKPFDVVGVGANSVDIVYRLPGAIGFDEARNKLRVRSRTVWCGGQTATALAACTALGLRTAYIGTVGSDSTAGLMMEELSRRGIDTSGVVVRACENPYAVILVDESTGERIVLWDRPGPLELEPGELDAGLIRSARLLHVDDVDARAAIAAAHIARAAGLPVTSDIDTAGERTEELVRAVTVPIFAARVPAALTGEADVERALRKIRTYHDGLLCVTQGVDGALLLDGDRLHRCPAVRLDAVDTTAAGDVFRGALIHGLLDGRGTAELLRWATLAAALSCTRPGAMNSVPSLDELRHMADRGS